MSINTNLRVEAGFIPQEGPQLAFIQCPADIVIYGGARGGGKTYASLGEFWIHSEDYGAAARGLMVRKTREDLKDAISTGSRMFGRAAAWREKGGFFAFSNGARLYCAYLETDGDAENYQGWSLTRVYVEELTQYASSGPVFKLLATLRSPEGVPCQFRATCNPGGVGHHWVKAWAIDQGPFTPTTDPETGLTRVFIPAKVTDNPALLANDPNYVSKLKASGTPQLVRAWLEGDWNVIEGSFFPEFSYSRHVITPFDVPWHWTKFRSMDWGSAAPFSVGWFAVVQDELYHDGKLLPRGAIVRYREWYGMPAGKPNEGLKIPAEKVAEGIVSRETIDGHREKISYGVLDPAAFAVISGPSIAETMLRHGVAFRRADNSRTSRDKRMGGWDQVRGRLIGGDDERPMIYFFDTCRDLIRTLPMMQHDQNRPEDVDSDGEDHAVDELRYACLSRPFLRRPEVLTRSKNPYLVANAFRLHELK
jgi:hypothetical protein